MAAHSPEAMKRWSCQKKLLPCQGFLLINLRHEADLCGSLAIDQSPPHLRF